MLDIMPEILYAISFTSYSNLIEVDLITTEAMGLYRKVQI